MPAEARPWLLPARHSPAFGRRLIAKGMAPKIDGVIIYCGYVRF